MESEMLQRLAKIEQCQDMMYEGQQKMSDKLDTMHTTVIGTLATHSVEIKHNRHKIGEHSRVIWGIVLIIVTGIGYIKLTLL